MERLAGAELPDWQSIEPGIRVMRLAAGDSLFRSGDAIGFVTFVRSGAIKMVYETPDGHAWIKGFAESGTVFTSLSSLQQEGAASFSAAALCETVVETLAFGRIADLADKHIAWQRALSRAFEIYGVRKELRERDLLVLSAEERYRKFMAEQTGLAALLTEKDIASYIRVTPVALSRIKARLKAG